MRGEKTCGNRRNFSCDIFPFASMFFKSCLLKMHQKASVCMKGFKFKEIKFTTYNKSAADDFEKHLRKIWNISENESISVEYS